MKILFFIMLAVTSELPALWAQSVFRAAIPKTWDEAALADWATPVTGLNPPPGPSSEEEYHRAPLGNQSSLSAGSVAQSGSALTSAQQKVVLSYFHDVLDGRKVELVDNLFQPDCVLHFGSSDVQGIAGVRVMVEGIKTTYSKLATEVHDIFESEYRVVVRITHRATGAGVLRSRIGNHDVSGKSITWDAIVVFRMKNGKIAEDWVNRDELGVLLSAGILKAK